jgi:FKBP-type peptidyl-prolyl cis-trans isomerase
MLHQGDSATFILGAKDFFTKTAQYPSVPAGIDSLSKIYFDIKVLKIESLEQMKKEAEVKAAKLKGEENGKLQNYISSKGIKATPSATGVYYVEEKAGAGRQIQKGDFIKMDFTVMTIGENKVFSTLDRKEPISFEFGQPFDTKGLDEGIGQMKKGSKAKIVVPSSMGFGEKGRKGMNGNEIIAPYSPVIYEVEILDIQTKAQHEKEVKDKESQAKAEASSAEAKEPILIQKYMKEKSLTAKPTASGMYYIERVKGKGIKATAGKKVSVHYTGRLLDGTVFDSSLDRKPVKPFDFTLGAGQVIQGWDEGIAMMNEGGKAILIIPSKLGYGSSGSGGVIKPFSPLVFDVELVKVNK